MFSIIYFFLSTLYMYSIIFITSIILNLFYIIKYAGKYKSTKIELFNLVKNVDSINDAINVMKTIIPKYYYDFFGGALNWFALPIVTYIRTKYESDIHHSKDCKEHCSVLRYIIENSKIKNNYFKTEILTFLSIKSLIKANHTILTDHWFENDSEKIDVFTPYRYYKTITKKRKKRFI